MLHALLLIQMLATGFMTGLIWFVQVVHYPLFQHVGSGHFNKYEDAHTRRTTLVVAPVMIIEALAALALLLMVPQGIQRTLAITGAILLAAIWGSTAVLQVPCHRALSQGFTTDVARRLNVSNWIRTIGWSLRLLIAVTMLNHATTVLVGHA